MPKTLPAITKPGISGERVDQFLGHIPTGIAPIHKTLPVMMLWLNLDTNYVIVESSKKLFLTHKILGGNSKVSIDLSMRPATYKLGCHSQQLLTKRGEVWQ
jgi:hypothetical protein